MPRSTRRTLGTLGRRYKPKFKSTKVGALTSRLRYTDHDQVNATNCVYTGFNDVGPVSHALRCLVEATLMHYMARAGDTRTNLDRSVDGPHSVLDATTGHKQLSTWSKMVFHWRRSGAQLGFSEELDAYDATNHYTVSTAATDDHNPLITYVSFDDMVASTVLFFQSRFSSGFQLASVRVYRGDAYQEDVDSSIIELNQFAERNVPIIYDPQAGRHVFNFFVSSKLKIQNTTDADGGAGGDLHSKDNIHANPLDGLVYKFRNRVPEFAPSFISSLPTTITNQMNNMEDTLTNYVPGIIKVDLAAQHDVFKVPPSAPYTIFKNSAGRSKILIKPGQHRLLQMTEKFEGSINSFAKKYVPTDAVPGRRIIPPGGSAMLIALKPTFRTGTNEDLEIQIECERYFQGTLKRKQLSTVPITNIVT